MEQTPKNSGKFQNRAFGPVSHYGPERNLVRAIVLVVVPHVLHIEMLNRVSCKGFFSIFFCRLELTGIELMNLFLPYMICELFHQFELKRCGTRILNLGSLQRETQFS